MLKTIPLLTAILFASLYPLCFWIHYNDPIKNNFHRFHLGFALFIAAIIPIVLPLLRFPPSVSIVSFFWVMILGLVTYSYWQKEYPKPWVVTIPCLIGILLLFLVHQNRIPFFLAELLGGFILATTTYAMNLGHGYLNVHGLPIRHLQRAVNAMGIFLIARFIWDAFQLLSGSVMYQGEVIPLYQFVARLDGFLLSIAILFGTIFPIISLYFVRGTLAVKSTQSATGILYVILSAVLIGDITYRYYLLKFGVAL